MKKTHFIKYVAALIFLMILLSMFACNTDNTEKTDTTAESLEESVAETDSPTSEEGDPSANTEPPTDAEANTATEADSKYVQFSLSITGKNGEGYSKAPDGTVTPPTTSGYATLAAPVEKTSATGEQITYVFDLEEIFSDYYVKDEETGHYIIDTFLITYARECSVDIEFMAFVDGDFADIGKLTSDDTVIYVTHATQKTYVVKDANTGKDIGAQ